MRMKVRKKMCRFLALIIMLCMGSSAYAETPTAEAQKKVAAYLTLLDDMALLKTQEKAGKRDWKNLKSN